MAKPNDTGFTFRGKPICITKTFGRPHNGLVKMGMQRGIYPEAKKLECVSLYAVTGNLQKVSELTKVPVQTLHNWRKQEWFQQMLVEVREENNEKIDAKFTEILEKSLELAIDRLQHGDFVLNKHGELVRKPVGLRDLSIVNAITVDKRQILRGLPTARTEQVVNSGDKLNKLAEAFMQLANKQQQPRIVEAEVIEIEATDSEDKKDVTPEPVEPAPTSELYKR